LQALPLFHARVLLVEVNPADQALARSMLQAMGCELASASSGAEVELLLKTEHFDLVLMGCDLPVQDGLEITRAIRARESRLPRGRRLPVVALSGPGQLVDAAGCLAAGMDELLGKPFSHRQLAEAMVRRLPPQLVEAPADTPAPSLMTTPAPTVMANIYSAAPSAPHPVLAERLTLYLENLPTLLQALRQHLDEADPVALARAAQALRVASSSVGATALAELCRRLENLAGSGELAGLPHLVDAAQSLADRLLPVLDNGQRQLA
jgi:CheY-like chemotaxis protein